MKIFRIIAAVIAAAAILTSLSACGETHDANYTDGTYTAKSAERQADEDGNGAGYGEIELELKDNKITSCTFKTYDLDGTLKDETYGADLTKENRMKAQKAVQAADKYAAMAVEQGTIDGIDAISGATVNYEEFIEAAKSALSQAEVT